MKTVAVVTGLLGGGVTISPVVQMCTCQQKGNVDHKIYHNEYNVNDKLYSHMNNRNVLRSAVHACNQSVMSCNAIHQISHRK